jgi:hypothetical protein
MIGKFDFSKITDAETTILVAMSEWLCHGQEVFNDLLTRIGEAKGYTDATTTPHQTPINEPKQPSPDFNKLPWRSYATKQTANPNESAWLFSNNHEAKSLLETLQSGGGKVTIGNFDYCLQGENQMFIARTPIKTKGDNNAGN